MCLQCGHTEHPANRAELASDSLSASELLLGKLKVFCSPGSLHSSLCAEKILLNSVSLTQLKGKAFYPH